MTDIVGNDTLRDIWDRMALDRPDDIFLEFRRTSGEISSYSYGEFNRLINKTANMFHSRGVGKGDMVAIHMRTCTEYLLTLFGLAKIGAVAVPVNDQNLLEECRYVVDTCNVKLAVVQDSFLRIYRQLEEDGRLPGGIILVQRDPAFGVRDDGPSFEELVSAQPDELGTMVPISSDDTFEIIFTSGTTARPKGVIVTHASMIYSGHYAIWQTSLSPEDRILTTMPACHSNFQLAALTPVIVAGATLVVVERYSASNFWKQVREHRATVIQCVSMMLRTLMLQPVDESERDHCVREVLYFLPVTDEEKRAFEERFGVRILNTYGSTESVTWVVTDPPAGERNWPSIGRAGLGYEVIIIDDEGHELPAGEIGEIAVKGVPGRTIMKGYYRNPEATASALSEDGWLYTGDKGYVDESGWFYFVDRKSNMIKRSGENISTTEIEDVLVEHPKIEEAAVIGIPDPIRDQAVKAFVMLKTGENMTEDEVVSYCASRLASFKVPSVVTFVDDFPRTCSMKIEKKLLR